MILKRSKASQRSPLPSRRPVSLSYYGARDKSVAAQNRNASYKTPARTGQKQWWKYLPTVLAAGLIIFCVIYATLLSSQPKIVILDKSASTGLMLRLNDYQQTAHKLLAGSIGNHDKLTIDTAVVATKMQQQFPELANVSVTLPLFSRQPTIYIQPAQPVLVLKSQNGTSLLVDATGKALQVVGSPASSLPVVNDQTGLSVKLGQIVLSPNDVAFMQLVNAQLQAKNLKLQGMILPAASRELDVRLKSLPYLVKFNLNDFSSAKQQVGTFLATKQYLADHHATPHQYIDARIPGRVYYK